MDNELQTKIKRQKKRSLRVRKRVRGDGERPRLCVVKTNAHIHLQLIDDEKSITLAGISTLSKEFKGKKSVASAKQLGLKMGELAKEKKVKRVVVDRGASNYHGIVAAVADGAREAGLEL